MDPPYEQSTRTSARYDIDMNREQHLKFIDLVLDSRAKMLISGYDCEIYDKLVNNGKRRKIKNQKRKLRPYGKIIFRC